MALNPEHLRAYLDRPWGLFERLRDESWGEEVRLRGPSRAIALSWQLGEQLRLLHPGWPSAEDRRRDLANHVRLQEILERASRAIEAKLAGT